MTSYISSIIGAAILSGIASLLSPASWRKYVGIVSGIVILCTLIAPLSDIRVTELFSADIPPAEVRTEDGEELRLRMVRDELKRRIEADIEERLLKEFGERVKASADIGVSADGKITGVNAIVTDRKISAAASRRLCEVYGVEGVSVKGRDKIPEKKE